MTKRPAEAADVSWIIQGDGEPADDGISQMKGPRTTPKEGDWTCQKCHNLNYADRMFCNMRKCNAPRPAQEWICVACGNNNFADRAFCNMRRCRAPRPGSQMTPMPGGALQQAMVQGALELSTGDQSSLPSRPARMGDWICSHCGNLNFADRAFCNMRKCSAPRALTEWVCSCGNANYADRLVCNMRKCGATRTDLHPTVLQELSMKGFGKGAAPRLAAAAAVAPGTAVS
mmetsp:Transcript_20910/g.43415  ORF Transcript_20910/g.43415 Transcript_20910/m.43415 type:complete len:230 (-) Transcript_20910:106-795(-)